MKIGIDIREASGARAGKGVYVRELVRALIALCAGGGHEFVLYTNQDASEFGGAPHVRVQRVNAPSLLWHVVVAARMRWIDRVDVFVAPTSYVIPWLAPSRCMVVVHDVYALIAPERHERRAVRIERATWRRAVTRSRAVVAVSEFTKSELLRLCPTARPITVVSNAVSLSAQRTQMNLPSEFLLFIGTLEPRKNLVRLLEAVAQLPAGTPPLLIAGKKGWYYDEIFAAAARLGLNTPGASSDAPRVSRVRFLGYVSDEEKAELLARATAFVFPSTYEGFGIPALEALSLGVPTVVSDIGALREVVGDAAVLVDPLDAAAIARGIAQVISDAPLRARLHAAGPAQAAKFSWEQSARVLSELFN